MQQHAAEFEKRRAMVLVVNFTPLEKLRHFLAKNPLPFTVVTDPDRKVYAALALGRARWWSFLRPSVLMGYFRALFQAAPANPVEGDDVLQLGGDFVVSADGQLVYARRSTTPTDRPSPVELLAAVDKSAGEN